MSFNFGNDQDNDALINGLIQVNEILFDGIEELSTYIVEDIETTDFFGVEYNMNHVITRLNRDLLKLSEIRRSNAFHITLNTIINNILNQISTCDYGSSEVIIKTQLATLHTPDRSRSSIETYNKVTELSILRYKLIIDFNIGEINKITGGANQGITNQEDHTKLAELNDWMKQTINK